MSRYAEQLETLFRAHSSPEAAESMEAYMRHQFLFLGIKTPLRNELARTFLKEHGIPKGNELIQAVHELWELPEREFQYTGMVLLDKHRKHAEKMHVDFLEGLVTTKSWWDTVDLIASGLIGFHFTAFPELIPSYTERWIVSDNLWLRRTALLFQLKYKQHTDKDRLFQYIRLCADENEFFIRKAIGWALREYSKTDASAVRQFVAETNLSSLSVREALKYIDR